MGIPSHLRIFWNISSQVITRLNLIILSMILGRDGQKDPLLFFLINVITTSVPLIKFLGKLRWFDPFDLLLCSSFSDLPFSEFVWHENFLLKWVQKAGVISSDYLLCILTLPLGVLVIVDKKLNLKKFLDLSEGKKQTILNLTVFL